MPELLHKTTVQGMVRFNSDTTKFEGYNGTDWINLVEENWGSLS